MLKTCLIYLEILNTGSISSKNHEMEILENLEYGINILKNMKWKGGIEYWINTDQKHEMKTW